MIDYNRILLGICTVIGLALAIVIASLAIATLTSPRLDSVTLERCHNVTVDNVVHTLCQ